MKRFGIYSLLFLIGITAGYAQTGKRAMTVEDLAAWKRVTDMKISDDGKWMAMRQASWEGDPTVILCETSYIRSKSIPLGNQMDFSASSGYLIVSVVPSKSVTDSLKRKKTKKEQMPMDKLLLHDIKRMKQEVIDSVRTYKLSGTTDWIAYQRGNKKDSTLYVRSLDGLSVMEFPAVTAYAFAAEGETLYFLSQPADDRMPSGLYTFSTGTKESRPVKEGKGLYKQITFDKTGERIGFLFCAEKDSSAWAYELYLSERGETARRLAGKQQESLPAGWMISPEGRISFADHTDYLYVGIAPVPREKDSTLLAENRPDVHVWTWDKGLQYTQQDYNRKTDLKRTYTAVVHPQTGRLVPLATTDIPQIITNQGQDAPVVLGVSSKPYEVSRMWRGRDQVDIYTLDIQTGERRLIKEGIFTRPQLSPLGDYAFWYSYADSSWYTYSIKLKKEFRLTTPQTFPAWNEQNDVPDFPSPHGSAGWTSGDEYLLLYDRYDIWRFDPRGRYEPVNLTRNGRVTRNTYRLVKLDKDEKYLNPKDTHFVSAFNEVTKGSGYYSMWLHKPNEPKKLLAGKVRLKTPVKAKKADRILYAYETYTEYPEIWSGDLAFKKKPAKLTYNGDQQDPFLWGTAELVEWTSLDGIPLQGVVYKPENFDPSGKYPLIVNFYERNSDELYSYRMPEPHRSTIDYHMYNSHGYIVFNPDIVYKDGYPGESCYNAVMSGIEMLIGEGYIDEKAIGAQGHSWGGYQVAYLATRTNLFAAIESGAPVVNMFNAYGATRWGSGMNRSFQYEHGQSRIGASIWEAPDLYYENSPLFTMDKVETPILIMHNDADGHVPWHLGVEYFVALRRLQKPVWLLNYTGEPHWPAKMPNKIDFQHRMFQFFEHYLKGKPMPQWMSEGIPAVDREFELGYSFFSE